MGLAQQQHAQAALADAAADGERQLARQQRLVERQGAPPVAARQGELAVQRLGVHPDAHGRDLQRPVQQWVVEQQVAVQAPVVIVRRAAVVGAA